MDGNIRLTGGTVADSAQSFRPLDELKWRLEDRVRKPESGISDRMPV
jgi:hypothetical protein